MKKAAKKMLSLLMTASSTCMLTPAYAEYEHLQDSDGQITKAIAFENGKYVYEGTKDDNEYGIYYNDGQNEIQLEDVDSLDNYIRYDVKYAESEDDEYRINMENGTVEDDYDTVKDNEDLLRSKIKNKLKKTNRYSSECQVIDVNAVKKDDCKNNAWYSYTAKSNENYDENEFIPQDTDTYDENKFQDKTRIEITLRGLWNEKIRIAGKEFDAGSTQKTSVKVLKNEIKKADFDNYTVGQIGMKTDDGENYYLVLTLLPKDNYEVPDELESDFLARYADGQWLEPEGWGDLKANLEKMGQDEPEEEYDENKFQDKTRVKVTIRALYNEKIKIDGQEIECKVYDCTKKSDVKALEKKIKNADFHNYTVGQVGMKTDDGKNYYLVLTLLPKDNYEVPDQLSSDFIERYVDGQWIELEGWGDLKADVEKVEENEPEEGELKSYISVELSNIWGEFTIAGAAIETPYKQQDDGNWVPDYDKIAENINNAKYSGYKVVKDAVNENGTVKVTLGCTKKLSSVPDNFVEGGLAGIASQLSENLNKTLTTYTTYKEDSNLENTTSDAVTLQFSDEEENKAYGAADSSYENSNGKAIYYGYVNEDGNYIDCSEIANLTVYDGEDVVKVEKFNETITKNGKQLKVGLPVLLDTLGQDDNYIYSLISVRILGAKAEYGNADIDEPLYYIQKVSKESGKKKDGACLPRYVQSYQLNGNMISGGNGWNGDNWGYKQSKDHIVDEYLENKDACKIKFINGNLCFTTVIEEDGDKKLQSTKMLLKNSARVILEDGKKVTEKLVFIDTSNSTDEEPDDWTLDRCGNVWTIYHGKIEKSEQGDEFKKVYKVDGSMNKINVYDEENLIAWSTENELYATVKDGEIISGNTKKTGWIKSDNQTWNLYDVAGNKKTGWVQFGSCWYYFDEQGNLKTGWIDINGNKYYSSASGVMKTGWNEIDNNWYYFNDSGVMQKNTIINGYKINENGVWLNEN